MIPFWLVFFFYKVVLDYTDKTSCSCSWHQNHHCIVKAVLDFYVYQAKRLRWGRRETGSQVFSMFFLLFPHWFLL